MQISFVDAVRRIPSVCLLAGWLAVPGRAAPPRARPASALSVNARKAGARGDGQTDDTAAIQRALDRVGAAGGGTVSLPRGVYRIASHLVIPDNTILCGVWSAPTAWSQYRGTTLLAEENRGRETGPPFILLRGNAVLRGVTIFYPGQDKKHIVPFPWCIAGSGADNASIIDVLMVNPYDGVDFATRNSGRHYIRNLYGQPLHIGLQVDKCYDIGRIENVHFWPFWTWDAKTAVPKFLREHGQAFVFGRTDWEYVLNTFCFGYGVGYRFIQTQHGACNGNFLGIGADATQVAVQVEQSQGPGLLITNGEFVSFQGPHPTEIVVAPSHTGVVQFNNCAFWGPAEAVARIAGTGSVSFEQCNFRFWDRGNRGVPAIRAEGGEVRVVNCRFNRAAPAVWLGPKIHSAVIAANHFSGPGAVINHSAGDVQVGLNAAGYRRAAAAPGEYLVDDSAGPPGFAVRGTWHSFSNPENMEGEALWAGKGAGTAVAVWTVHLPRAGRYAVDVYCGPDPNRDHAKNAPYRIRFAGGEKTVRVDQHGAGANWVRLGVFPFRAGAVAEVRLSNDAGGNVVADAVRFVAVSKIENGGKSVEPAARRRP